MALDNKWVRYIDRSYLQIKQRVLTNMAVLTPEITDHTESNPFVKQISIWAGIAEMLGYYIDNAARESHLATARLYWSGIKIAASRDYRVHAHLPSTGEVTFSLDNVAQVDVVIPINTEVATAEGIRFFTVEAVTIQAGSLSAVVSVRQSEAVADIQLGVSTGEAKQSFTIDDTVVDSSVVVKVNGLGWDSKLTLGYSLPTANDYVQTVSINRLALIVFGDGINGAIPASGSVITAGYYRTQGEAGNVGANTITRLISTVQLPAGVQISVTNIERTSGGSGVETLAQLKQRVPKALRTKYRAVTPQDFIDVAELKSGVAKAGVNYSCGKPADVYIVPDGGGIASIDLLGATQEWLEERRLITIGVNVKPAGEIRIKLGIELNVLPQYPRADVVERVRQNLANFLSFRFQDIGGSVQLSDIYEVVENTEGVRYSKITTMKPIPYARPTNTEAILNWERDIKEASTSVKKWGIKMISDTTYELTVGGSLLGVYTVGVTVSFMDFTLRVLAGAYATGDIWEFYTYPFYGSVVLSESSLPVSLPSDISITANGGL